MNVAELGIQVDSGGSVEKTTKSLDNLTNATKKAEAASHGLSSATKNAGSAAAAVSSGATNAAAALSRESAAATQAAAALKLHAAAANQNSAASKRMGGSFSGLAAQFQDIGVTAAMGMNPMIIALQQGTQIAGQMEMAMQSGASAAGVFGQAFRSLLSPVSLVVISLTALVAAGLQMVDWPALAASALNAMASVLQTIAPYATAAAAALALLYAPAIVGGVVQLIALLGRLATAAFGLAAAFAAANPATAFILGVTAAVAAANIFRDELTQIFGVDIVGAAKDGVNAIIGAFVGGYQGIKAAWSALPAALGDIVYATANAVITGVQNMVNKVGETINGYIASINSAMKSLPFGLGDSISIGTIGAVDFGGIANPYAGAADAAQSAIGSAISGAMGTDYVGQLGEVISQGASMASDKLRELAGSLTNVEVEAGKAGSAGKKAGEATAKGFDAAKAAADRAKEALSFAKDVAGGFLTDLRTGLQNGEGLWKSFGKAALNVLDKIISKVQDQLIDALFSASSIGGGGGGGLFGGLLGGIGKIFGFASGGYTGDRAASAVAGVVHGGEYVFSKKATDRIGVGNLEAMHRSARGYASGGYVMPANQNGQAQDLHITVGVSVDKNGNLLPFVQSVSKKEAKQEVAAAAPSIVNAANQQVVPTMAKYQSNKAGSEWR